MPKTFFHWTSIIAAVVFSSAAITAEPVFAATVTAANDYPSTLQANQLANHRVVFTTPTGISEGATITLTFSSSFDTASMIEDDVDIADDGVDLTTASSCAGTDRASVSMASDVLTVTVCSGDGGAITAGSSVAIEIGTNATSSGTGANQIRNPTTAGTFFVTIGGTFNDFGSIALPIISASSTNNDDTISVIAEIPSSGSGVGGESSETEEAPQTQGDITAPAISNIVVSNITASSVMVHWTTDESATSAVSYGLSSSLELGTVSNTTLSTSHSLAITSLKEGKTYSFQVRSSDADANQASSSIQTFTTLDLTAPLISNVEVTDITTSSARVTWQTNEAATQLVEYGESTSYGLSSASNVFATEHSVILTSLGGNTIYHFRLSATDLSSNTGFTSDQTFVTAADVPPSNVSNLQITNGNQQVVLTWNNPTENDLAGIRVLVCDGGYPIDPAHSVVVGDCAVVVDGLVETATKIGLQNNTTYYFAVYAYDKAGQLASGALGLGIPSASEEEVPSEEESVPTPEPTSGTGTGGESQDTSTGSAGFCGDTVCAGSESFDSCPIDCSIGEEPTSVGAEEGKLNPSDVSYFVAGRTIELVLAQNIVEVLSGNPLQVSVQTDELKNAPQSVQLSIGSDTYFMRLDDASSFYVSDVITPETSGSFVLSIRVSYADQSEEQISSLLNVIPRGHVFEDVDGEEVALANAQVTTFEMRSGELIVWDGSPFNQFNPTETDANGAFAWYVPRGEYEVHAFMDGFDEATSGMLSVTNAILNPSLRLAALIQEESQSQTEIGGESIITTPFVESVARAGREVQKAIETIREIPAVQEAAEVSIPTLAVAAGANIIVLSIAFDLLPLLQYLFTAPILLFGRRKRKSFGTVYHAVTKQPVDLAVVRLYELQTQNNEKRLGRLVASRVTDREGRFFFLVQPGAYALVASRSGFEFPSHYLQGVKQDVHYLDVYHGEPIQVTDKDAVLTPNVPLDPVEKFHRTPSAIIWRARLRVIQHVVALTGIIASIIFAVIRPNIIAFVMIGVQCMVYLFARRLAKPHKPKNWGIVYDKQTGRPLSRVVARIFEPTYHKLLDTQLTDAKGRYAFLLGPNEYYAVFEKEGFRSLQVRPIDFKKQDEATGFAMDLELEKK